MKIAATLMLVLALGSAAASARDGDGVEVRAALDRFISAFNDLDWERFRSALADDVTVFNPELPEVRSVGRLDGRAEVEAGFREVFAASRKNASGPPYLHIQPRNVAVQVAGEAAIVTFEFDREAGSIGRRTIVFRHDPGGWKIAHIHASNTARR